MDPAVLQTEVFGSFYERALNPDTNRISLRIIGATLGLPSAVVNQACHSQGREAWNS